MTPPLSVRVCRVLGPKLAAKEFILPCFLISLKDQSRERTDSSGGREKIGGSPAAGRSQTQSGGARASDSRATAAGGRGESRPSAEQKTRRKEERWKVLPVHLQEHYCSLVKHI